MTAKKIDYKRELEAASKGMIMIHDPKLLIKLIVRMIVSKVRVKHAGMILYEPGCDAYVLNISRGETGARIPQGFTRFDKDHPFIQLFSEKEYRSLMINKSAILTHDLNKLIWQEGVINGGNGNSKELLHNVGEQMRMLNVEACVPAKYKHKLMAVLLLGEKCDGNNFDKRELDFFAALASDAAMAIRNAQLFGQLKKEAEKNHDLFMRTTKVLGSAIEVKDKYTRGHTERTTNYSVAIARQMVVNGSMKFDEKFLENLYIAGLLHDIGKIGIPESILNKETDLTPEEYDVVRRHPVDGVKILKLLSELTESLDGVKHHHERYDGKGYPDGLKGDETPMIASIIGVADAFDAMITDRPYRKGLSKKDAIDEVSRHIGTQFNPMPARAMIELFVMGAI